MNNREQQKLLREILPPEDIADFRKSSLECSLAGMRRERRRRHIVRFSAVAMLFVGLSISLVYNLQKTAQHEGLAVQVPDPSAPASLASSHVELINDDQLLSLVTNQPVALIGGPGEQRLVFLGKSGDQSEQN